MCSAGNGASSEGVRCGSAMDDVLIAVWCVLAICVGGLWLIRCVNRRLEVIVRSRIARPQVSVCVLYFWHVLVSICKHFTSRRNSFSCIVFFAHFCLSHGIGDVSFILKCVFCVHLCENE